MPFGIQKSKNKWKVINKHTGRVLGTHSSKENAKKQLAALKINYYKEDLLKGHIEARNMYRGTAMDNKNNIKIPMVGDLVKSSYNDINFNNDKAFVNNMNRISASKNIEEIEMNNTFENFNRKEKNMNLKESNELIMSLAHKYKISISVLEHLWNEAISKQEENAKTKEEKDKSNPKFWKGVKSKFKTLIYQLDLEEAKAIMDSREKYTKSTSQWLDHLQNGDYAAAEKVFPDIIKSKLDIMISNGKEKYLKQLSDKFNKKSKE